MLNILFVEDEEILGQLVKDALEYQEDFVVTWVKDGREALLQLHKQMPDICIYDVMIPNIDGFTLAKETRKLNNNLPIIFLTARSGAPDVVKGFESGGNDYLKKPFSIEELVVRVRNLLKQSGNPGDSNHKQDGLSFGNFRFFETSQILQNEEEKINLTGRECEILKELIIHKNKVVDKKKLQMQLWGADSVFNSRTVDVYITKLRKYIASDPNLTIINVRGYGYKLVEV